ncbi:LamB/YcsF family protein [Evansella sp. AB-rgal1]|uniref:LamB/YcsF family protein n=1 Tax=Evansella sp. AB-rgal1 TaxID=3242696 RepID=UPI00359EC4C1
MDKFIDINSDLGESFGSFKVGNDEEVLKHISSANIACGFHAGDHNVIHKTVQLSARYNVGIGAHPGLPDLLGFGRRWMDVSTEEVYNMVVYQVNAVKGFAQLYQQKLQHVKPHGALFNKASKDKEIACAIARAVRDTDPNLILYGLSSSELIIEGEKIGLQVANEVFADRTYQPDGTLTPRSDPNAIIHDPKKAMAQVLQMIKDGSVTAVDGSVIPIQADTICVHGDEPQAVLFVKQLKKILNDNAITVKKPGGVRYDERF